ncbi:MAG: hypothetical protein GY746_07475 [Gammaproteobacteria bacterium]|nr:hypothetical protein [Gammaproteobacteria bacterium]
MADKLELLLEAERRGILPADKAELLVEARRRKLIPDVSPSANPYSPDDAPGGFVRGLTDIGDAVGQITDNILPGSVREGVNWLHNKGAEYGFGEKLPPGGITEQIKQKEAAYQQSRVNAGETGLDGDRLLGNVLNPVNLAAAANIPRLGSLAKNTLMGASAGGVLAPLTMPAYSDDFLGEKLDQAKLGAAGGGVVPVAAAGASRVLKPQIDKAVKALHLDEIPTTVGQRLGGAWKDVEDKLSSVPFTGKVIENARMRGYEKFNDVAINRALKPIGQELPGGLDPYQKIAHTRKQLSEAYDNLLGRMSGKIDDQFQSEFDKIVKMVDDGMPPELGKIFRKRIEYETVKRITPHGKMSGESLKRIQEGLRVNAEKFQKSQDPFQRDLGDAFASALDSFNSMLSRNNPTYAEALKRVNTGYANFKRVQDAAGKIGADEGLFTPAQLHNAVYKGRKGDSQFSEGRALMQDLSGSAKKVLPNKVPDSGTAGRTMVGNVIPGIASAAITSPLSLLYGPKVGPVIHKLLSTRPDGAALIADFIEKTAPALTVPGGVVAQGLLGGPK